MMTPRRLYRVLALAEAITWTLLIAGMLGKYVFSLGDIGVRIAGSIHGFVFLSYCVVTVLVGIDRRWGAGRILLGLGSAIVPYLTVPFERHVEKAGLLADSWRLRGERGDTALERLVGAALRRPFVAAAILLVVVAVVFTVLLQLGPPTEWGR